MQGVKLELVDLARPASASSGPAPAAELTPLARARRGWEGEVRAWIAGAERHALRRRRPTPLPVAANG